MHINDLPNDVFYLVLHWFVGCGRDLLYGGLRRRLPVLAVCQRWRHMALFMVYGPVAVKGRPGPGHFNSGPYRTVYGWSVVESNVRLIASAGHAQAVKRASIEVYYRSSPSFVFGDAARFVRSVASEWRGVKSLVIHFRPPTQSTDVPQPSILNNACIEAACTTVVAAFPGVSELCLSVTGSDFDPVLSKIFGRLASLYAGQLERLELKHPVDLPHEVVLSRLKRLDAKHENGLGDRRLRMDPDVVEALSLGYWPCSQAWAALGLDGSSREVTLPRLRKLQFQQEREDVQSAWRVHLPSLEWLDMYTAHRSCPLLESLVLPPCMTAIKISAPPVVIRAVAKVDLPAVQRLEIKVSFWDNDKLAALPATNHIMSNTRASKWTFLILSFTFDPLPHDSITCTTPTELSINVPLAADAVFALIHRLPNLVVAQFWSVSTDDVQTDISVPDPDDTDLMEPFDARITLLGIRHPVATRPRQLDAVVKYMALKMPALTRLQAPWDLSKAVYDFVCAYSKRYPHLRYVKQTFG